ncbi:MAG TPA: thiamine phosphate synthase, partial [Pirellulaceae bacterium]|nr:thiamine phosphate synthase [Pirellulaceae bacterium]
MSHPCDLMARLRVLDANANRAGEGLRVVEEYARFALDDRYLTELLKSIRHDLTHLLRLIPLDARYSARDTIGDVGTTVTTESEARRESARDIAEASIKRSEQALRAIEEYSKGEFPQAAAAAEQLRYRLYTVARALRTTATS